MSQPSSINVFLTRTIAIGSSATDETAPRRSNNTFPEHVGKAFFWPSDEGAPQDGVRILHGEIDVRRGLKPDFLFPRFCVRVSGLLFRPGMVLTKLTVPHLPLSVHLFGFYVRTTRRAAPHLRESEHSHGERARRGAALVRASGLRATAGRKLQHRHGLFGER